jgi:hypothetical protein
MTLIRPRTHGTGTGRDARLRPELAAAAGFLGLGRPELRDRLEDGATLASLARERGRSLSALVETMVAIARARLDAAVRAGSLSAAARDDMLRDLRERIVDTAGESLPFPTPVDTPAHIRRSSALTKSGV